jgi:hypothetical protein
MVAWASGKTIQVYLIFLKRAMILIHTLHYYNPDAVEHNYQELQTPHMN